ncbi:hypothetical protein BKG82_26245 [Mycobacteroides chelonae]|uniref:Uncharacterized protein n=1 Tax=Mycobacteroides chelonae TaxID=1774 RepID=A0A1S1LFV3_MYCCH|nr:hypothetical protein [Mycobacteroides chelonae]OHU47161.1 hypothetical protein BKG82_26245 [Mycobacteroides chelonae]
MSTLIDTEVLKSLEAPINPETGERYKLAIDADCPGCGWPERNFDTQSKLFGCRKCEYTSADRTK